MSSINPGIARAMTGLLERTRTRRTFTSLSSSSTTSVSSLASVSTPVPKSKPKVNDLLAECSQLRTSLEKAADDYRVLEKQKNDTENQSQEILQQLIIERETSGTLRTERDNAVNDAGASRKAVLEAEERAEASRKVALEAEGRAEASKKAALAAEERVEVSRKAAFEAEQRAEKADRESQTR
ncbi:hypothetical protein BDP27DRAFT_1423358 [Rhodocollybia butyracea]|uniref:Uncharacterized protein n=1 Tax=Rhodocollybia butyracea TaxID=206335 RepID=A0A9P5PJW5_9AGAR|nr:hypothetical protein BDP27DRAFT_1423358 [Rhodocollybia butyracea]